VSGSIVASIITYLLICLWQGGIFTGNMGTGFPGNPCTSGEIFGRSHAFLMIYTSERNDFLLLEIISFQWYNFPREWVPVKINGFLSKEMT
jgi:hypothetical protein